MSEYICPDGTKVYIVNMLSDETIAEDLSGFQLPFNNQTMTFWNSFHAIILTIEKREININDSKD